MNLLLFYWEIQDFVSYDKKVQMCFVYGLRDRLFDSMKFVKKFIECLLIANLKQELKTIKILL